MTLVGLLESLILPVLIVALPLVWVRIQDSLTPSSRLRRRIADHQALLKDVPDGEAATRLGEEIDRQVGDLVGYWEKKRQASESRMSDTSDADAVRRAPSDRGIASSIAILLLGVAAVSLSLVTLVDGLRERNSAGPEVEVPSHAVERLERLPVRYGDCIDLDSDEKSYGARAATTVPSGEAAANLLCVTDLGMEVQHSNPYSRAPSYETCLKTGLENGLPIPVSWLEEYWICTRTADGRAASVRVEKIRDNGDVTLDLVIWHPAGDMKK